MKIKSIAECSHLSVLQNFWPALSDNWSWKPISGHLVIESGRFTQVLLYIQAQLAAYKKLISMSVDTRLDKNTNRLLTKSNDSINQNSEIWNRYYLGIKQPIRAAIFKINLVMDPLSVVVSVNIIPTSWKATSLLTNCSRDESPGSLLMLY